MDGSLPNEWPFADQRQQKPRPTLSQPSFWQQAQNFRREGVRPDNRAYQPTVEHVIDDSRMYYGSASSKYHEIQSPLLDPYPWARGSGGMRPGMSLASPIGAATAMSTRRSFAEPRASFSPPSLVSDSSSLSSASSNFCAATPTFDQQPRRRSSQQAFPDQIDRDALARANKRMASDWNLSDSPFHTESYDPFAPLQPRAPFVAGSGLYADHTNNRRSFDVRRESASSIHSSQRRHSHVQVQNPPAPVEDAAAFKSHLNSELNRRNVADKTVSSIRSDRARALAQAKEDTRRTDWAKEVLLKFPMQCALAESLRPEDMMAAVARSGVLELTASIA